MIGKTPRLFKLVGLLLTLALAGSACSSGDSTDSEEEPTASESPITATLNGSGATFPQAFYEVIIESYKEIQPGLTITYGGGGSGKGRQELQDGVVDYAGSDGLVKEEDVAKYKGGEFLYVPTIAAPITVSYNLEGVDDLKLDAPTLAKIFQREITKWDDPAIKALNDGVEIPSTDITVAHRSDGSGTTENFTKYLVAAAPDAWKLKSGSTVEWPADTQAGNGNSGVAQIVKDAAGGIGYVDLADSNATGLQQAVIKNKAGEFVGPTLEAASAALEGAEVNDDLSYNPLNAEGDAAYPITAPTWILVYKNQTDKAKAEGLKAFLTYLLTDGQELAAEADAAPLAESLKEKALAQVDAIVVP